MTDKNGDLAFLPLGGTGEIGMNLNLYRSGGSWLAVDCGIGFGGGDMPEVEVMMADPAFIAERRDRLRGLVITHGHEDHVGAVAHLWRALRCPVYATPFTAAVLRRKLSEAMLLDQVPVHVIPPGGSIDLAPFAISFIRMAHSIPEAQALAIRTPQGTVLHTGDWKIDTEPVILPKTDEAKLRALGDEGCLALIGDSTNAVRDGRSPSEREVGRSLQKLIAAARGRVAVTTFASNVGRVRAVAEAAAACDREVVLVGRAMERIAQVARETGYLDGINEFRSMDAYGYLPPDKVVALCTGSQGEPRAALARIAQDEHPEVTLSKGDLVIFSSRAIPGNEKPITKIINGLIAQGVEVITDRTHLVHVSGHPRREELQDMLSWVRPQTLIPVHGEALHMHEHGELARKAGIKQIVTCQNGDLIRLAPGAPSVIDEVPAGRIYKDGALLVNAEDRTVADRRRLGFAGVISVAIVVSERGELATDPEIEITGIPQKDMEGREIGQLAYNALMEAFDSMPRTRRRDPDTVAEAIQRAVRGSVSRVWRKKPLCHVHVLTV